ncbi:hypothetical protein [Marinospirillum sp.]|uniref:hypothetical protein n=1 Tax=Marinospirillum sp. TaxID=2183934 RepID=UPI00384A93BB
MGPGTYFLHFLGLVIVLVGLNLRPKRKKLGTSLAVLGFLIGTSPVWYGYLVTPSPSELREQQRQEFMVPDDQ